jgi:hypothetical protein
VKNGQSYRALPWYTTDEDPRDVAAAIGVSRDTIEFDLTDGYGYTYAGPAMHKVLAALARPDVTPTLSGRVHTVATGLLAAVQDERLPSTILTDRSPFETVALVTYLCGVAEGEMPWHITEWVICHHATLADLPSEPSAVRDFPPCLAGAERARLWPDSLELPVIRRDSDGTELREGERVSLRVQVTHSKTLRWSTVRDIEVPADRVSYLLAYPRELRKFVEDHGCADDRDQYGNAEIVDTHLDDAVHVGPDIPLTYPEDLEEDIAP